MFPGLVHRADGEMGRRTLTAVVLNETQRFRGLILQNGFEDVLIGKLYM